MLRYVLSFALFVMITGCVGPPKGRIPPRGPSANSPTTADLRQCLVELDRLNARYSPVPDQDDGQGCALTGAVRLSSVGIPITNIVAIRCTLARNVALWVRDSVQPAARQFLGSPIVRIESMGSYSCRNVIGRPQAAGTRSEHATGNAIDIGAFVLADGRRVTVAQGWQGAEDERRFLRAIRQGGCARFQTVLSPDFNAAHWDHLHFDMGRGPFCR